MTQEEIEENIYQAWDNIIIKWDYTRGELCKGLDDLFGHEIKQLIWILKQELMERK